MGDKKKIAFTGDRNYRPEYFSIVYEELDKLDPSDTIIVGDCPTGVDHIVLLLAKHVFKWPKDNIVVKYAQWKKYGKAAGPIRNKQIINEEPEILYAIHRQLSKSKGTKNCVNQAIEAGIKTNIYEIGGK